KISQVSTARAQLGAYQNRLEHTINNANVAVENLSASESRIRDTDMAQEMMSFTRSQILTQAGTAMLSQANQSQQGVLSLLR
ncbi:flagellin, partial [Couchioplanes caeruleus]